jgi:hypothetical protein|nr:MAG TPA: tail assembly chaperone protein [Caudoviricetes sp.]
MRVESRERPANSFILDNRKGNLIEVTFFDDIKSEMRKEQDSDNEVEVFTYKVYKITTTFRDNLEEHIQNNLNDWLESLKEQEKNSLASEIREKRNKLLEESDKYMILDRLTMNFPQEISLTNVVSVLKDFFKTLSNIKNGSWAKYRQELRDLPNQKGFPYDVKFPDKPEE